MSIVKELLKDALVEWKVLGELVDIQRGRVMSKNYLAENEGEYPVYSSQTANNGEIGKINTFDFEGEFLTWTTDGANAGTIFYREGKFSITNVCGLINIKENTTLSYRFLFHWLNIEAKSHVYSGMGNPKLMSHQMGKIKIPIPSPEDPVKSLEIQQEIVRVLDDLSVQNKSLTAALAKEIKQRKKEYEYYREELFRFEVKQVEWKTLGEVAKKITSGGTPNTKKREYWENGSVPWMSSGEVNLETIYETEKFITVEGLNNSSAKYIPANSIVLALAGQGKTRGMVARTKIKLTTNQSLAAIILDNEILNTDYVFHFLKTQYNNLREISSGNGARGGLNLQMINKYKMPIPFPNDKEKSIQEQQRIVHLLNQFDVATKNIVAQLEKEIDLRNKQYEYYRNLLLTFPKDN